MGSIISRIKNSVQSSGGNFGKLVRVAPDKKVRLRFLTEMDQGQEFKFHGNWDKGVDALCREHFGEKCPMCDNEDLTTTMKWGWSVWDVEAKEVKIFLWKASSKSPISQFLSYYENYGTILDRDYVIERKGTKFDTSYTIIPMDKSKFRNEKAKAFSDQGLLKILGKAFPVKDLEEDEDEDEEEAPKKGKKKNSKEEVEEELDLDWLEEKLESEDIDEDDFCEYHEISSLKKLKKKTKKEIKAMIKDFQENGDFDDEDEDDDDDDDEE